ncbi:PadR family transcriptional regulator [Paenibacillus gallinarum]|uniref:PadR family transcriptional regulator n=1 Tax=Paenibacillus gallinarum TaxID=2762232 RepID=A0ABR8SY99_9BACL|nr:PadR family transcriptional regulator [Paenibacillus gallinarum]MBD7968314.1 PadR family transcriptional regulator [Paenibacillus gallinarum]
MNTLGYAILSVLSKRPSSGYELASCLDMLWPAKHSQIYPLLTKMEQKGLLSYEHIEQIGKPNKKIYSITEKGRITLESWIKEPASNQIVRDDFLIKVYAIWLKDEESAKKLIEDRLVKLNQQVSLQVTEIEKANEEQISTTSKQFGKYILLCRSHFLNKEEISWCHWVLNLFKSSHISKLILGLLSANTLYKIMQNLTVIVELGEF